MDSLPNCDIVLVGAGHTNAHIIRMWRMKPIPGARLTCVSDNLVATYSGMLAGTLAGDYRQQEMEIDLVRLCASCGVRFVHARVLGCDADRQALQLEDRAPLPFDLLSVGIGSQPTIPAGCESGLSIKPMQTFHARLATRLEEIRSNEHSAAPRIGIVGGGAAGVEIATCLQKHLRREYPSDIPFQISLLESGENLLAEMPARTQMLAKTALENCDIELRLNARVIEVGCEGTLSYASGEREQFDLVIWATSAKPSPLLAKLNLPLDERGFLLTRSTLQCVGNDDIFAVGDAGSVEGEDYAKAGVYAVRQGPVLWENLRRKAEGRPLKHWRPQSKFLSLLNTGDERAILTYYALSTHSHWAWKLKDWIDTRFMAKYQQYEPPGMESDAGDQDEFDLSHQCGGCGCKASAQVLRDSLPGLRQPHFDQVLMGLDSPDDVAVLATEHGGAVAVSTDFFSSFLDDPYLLGRVAALNALSDLYAKDISPTGALSIAILPPGSEAKQSQLLSDLLAGAQRELNSAGVPIVGGHSIVGPRLVFGFTVLGDAREDGPLKKTELKPGDHLVLTKPLGTGVLLAAHMQAACEAQWWQTLVKAMLQSNQDAAKAARMCGVDAATDVTGFGLAGHLQEMLASGELAAELSLASLPILPGTVDLFERGLESSLAPSNQQNCDQVEIDARLANEPRTKVLFDPQTSGGLLLAVSEDRRDALLAVLGKDAAAIGRIVKRANSQSAIRLVP